MTDTAGVLHCHWAGVLLMCTDNLCESCRTVGVVWVINALATLAYRQYTGPTDSGAHRLQATVIVLSAAVVVGKGWGGQRHSYCSGGQSAIITPTDAKARLMPSP